MPKELVTIDDSPSKCFLMSVGSAWTKMRTAGERLSMTSFSIRQLQSLAAKHTQCGDQRREILLGQAEDRAIGQRQLDPWCRLRGGDGQLQEVRRGLAGNLPRRPTGSSRSAATPGPPRFRISPGVESPEGRPAKISPPHVEPVRRDVLPAAELRDRQPALPLSLDSPPPFVPNELICLPCHAWVPPDKRWKTETTFQSTLPVNSAYTGRLRCLPLPVT